MTNYILIKKIIKDFQKSVYVFLILFIFLFISISESFSSEDLFIIDNVEVDGVVNLNFSREKYIEKAFKKSFEILKTRVLLSKDLNKISTVNLDKIKKLISSFQILNESYDKDNYKIIIKIAYNEFEVKKFLSKKNISFSKPENISVIFYPVLFKEDEFQNFNENFFYKQWKESTIESEVINFILPLEDLDDISKIIETKDRIEDLDVRALVSSYDVKNYVFALFDYHEKKLNIQLKTNFNNNQTSKNILYNIKNINDQKELDIVLKDLKLKINDIWKEENLINFLMPLSIKIKFQHTNIKNLDELREIFEKISFIENYTLEEFNISNSFYKVYYYGDPKKLKSELLNYGYTLSNDQGFWKIYLNE